MDPEIESNPQAIGCRYINTQLAKLSRHLEAAKTAEDNEDIHQVRVACRRLRSAFIYFSDCLDNKTLNTAVKHLKKLMRTLGTARDLDVQIEFLNEVIASLAPEHKRLRPGIQRIMLRRRQRRNAVQADVLKRIELFQRKHILTNIHLGVERFLFEHRSEKPYAPPPAVIERFGLQLQRRVGDIRRDQHCLNQPDDHAGHHTLRILVKKLRYEMEISELVLKRRLKDHIKHAKKIQTLLGQMHDCIVWESDISDFIEQEKQFTLAYFGHNRPFARLMPGLEFLRHERKIHHDALLAQTARCMAQLEEEAFWDTLLVSFNTVGDSLQPCCNINTAQADDSGRPAPEENSSA